jgi:FG-GAP repeat
MPILGAFCRLPGHEVPKPTTPPGDSAGDQFGWSVAGAGDVNKDGYADVVVGARFDDNKGKNSGSARVFSGKDGKVLYTFDGDRAYDQFGAAVAGAGDVDRDGYADLLIGMPYASYGGARVLSGKTGAVLQTFRGDGALDYFGWSVAAVGDVNKDGRVDFVVGAPYDDNNGGASGSARVLSSVKLALTTDVHAFSSGAKANTQTLSIDVGASHGGRSYWVFGSATGTTPGVTLGGVKIPLNPDPWTDITIGYANSAVLVNTRGTLSASGTATARIRSGPYAATLVGLVFHHACVVIDGQGKLQLASNPVPLLLAK